MSETSELSDPGREETSRADDVPPDGAPAPVRAGPTVLPPEPEGAARVCEVALEEFEGPLDLLLHLVRRHELDILDIPISFVCEKYLEYIDFMQALDLEVAGDYLVMAATLAYLKSRELVPQHDELTEEGELESGPDPREQLIARLLEYQTFKEAALRLDSRPMAGRDTFGRGQEVELPPMDAGLAPITLFRLADAYQRVLERARIHKSHEVVLETISVASRMEQLTGLLIERSRIDFEALFLERTWSSEGELRSMLVVTLMSVLELVRMGIASVHQSPEAESIVVERVASEQEAREALRGYDESISFGQTPGASPKPGEQPLAAEGEQPPAETETDPEPRPADAEADGGTVETDAGTSEFEAGMSVAEAGTSEFEAGMSVAEVGTSEFEAGISESEAGISVAEAGISVAEAGSSEIEASSSESEASSSESEASSSESEASSSEVEEVGTWESDAGSSDADPGTSEVDPQASAQEHGTGAPPYDGTAQTHGATAQTDEADAAASELEERPEATAGRPSTPSGNTVQLEDPAEAAPDPDPVLSEAVFGPTAPSSDDAGVATRSVVSDSPPTATHGEGEPVPAAAASPGAGSTEDDGEEHGENGEAQTVEGS